MSGHRRSNIEDRLKDAARLMGESLGDLDPAESAPMHQENLERLIAEAREPATDIARSIDADQMNESPPTLKNRWDSGRRL